MCAFIRARVSLQGRVFDDVLNWMILDNQPLSAPEHPALKKAFRTATGNLMFDYGGRAKFRKALLEKKDTATAALKAMLKGASTAVTTDIWTSASNVSTDNMPEVAPHPLPTFGPDETRAPTYKEHTNQ